MNFNNPEKFATREEILAVLAACDFSLCIGAQVLTFRTRA
jgi:hypothetical protein